MRAVRKDSFKLLWLVEPYGPDGWPLCNLAKDSGETVDLSEGMPYSQLNCLYPAIQG